MESHIGMLMLAADWACDYAPLLTTTFVGVLVATCAVGHFQGKAPWESVEDAGYAVRYFVEDRLEFPLSVVLLAPLMILASLALLGSGIATHGFENTKTGAEFWGVCKGLAGAWAALLILSTMITIIFKAIVGILYWLDPRYGLSWGLRRD